MTPDEQRTAALKIANAKRTAQAERRRRIRSLPNEESRAAAVAVLREPGEWSETKLGYLLESITRFGPVRISRLVRKLNLPPARLERELGRLSQRERNLLADHLENPNLPSIVPNFTPGELAVIQELCLAFADRTARSYRRERLQLIARKCEVAA